MAQRWDWAARARVLAEDIEGVWELGCDWWTNFWKTSRVDAVYEAQGGAPSTGPHPWPDANAGGSSVAAAVVEASPELELRRAGAGGTAQFGVSRLYPDRG
jgi:hypothetical protein